MITQLVTIGDSWPAGSELENPVNSFPVLIAKQLGIESINLSQPATSADQAVYKLLHNDLTLNWSNTLILFCLTGISRSMYIDYQPMEIHPTTETPISLAYYKYIHSNELDQFNRIRNILTAQQYCQSLGCQILFVNNWDKTPEHPAIDQTLFYNKTLTEILNVGQCLDDKDLDWSSLSVHKYIQPNQCHPNIAGHTLIANTLSTWIKEKLNDKSVS